MRAMAGVFLVLCFSAALSCRAEDAKPNEKPLDEVKKEIADGKAILLDVRNQDEWNAGHVKDAQFLPLPKLKFGTPDLTTLPKDKTIYTYCAVGMRARAAATILNGKGYQATPLKQGFDELSKNGFEAAK